MAKAKKGYTDNQNTIAEWIVAGRKFNDTHAMLRKDKVLREYAINPLAQAASHWYLIVRDGKDSTWVTDNDGGVVTVQGNGGPGGYTQEYNSSYGIHIINTQRAGRKPNGKGHHRVIQSD
jgi:hypothetical protein